MSDGDAAAVDSGARSTNRSRRGVLFVHGVGATGHSDTLIDFGQAMIGWVARWQRARQQEPMYGPTVLNFNQVDAGSDEPLPYATLHLPELGEHPSQTWVVSETWWASSTRPLPFWTMFGWSVRYLGALLFYLGLGMGHRITRINPRQTSIHDGNLWYRVVDALTALVHFALYAVVGIAGYVLLVPVFVLGQVPLPVIQDFILVKFLRVFLQYNAAALRVYYEDEIQAANMRRRMAESVAWLTRPASEGGGDCESVTIVAHSGGSWVSHGMLTDPTYAWAARRVRKFITLGCGLNKIWDIAPTTIRRLSEPVRGDIYWVDFWGSYDPVPAGWLKPPRVGADSWRTIYAPSPRIVERHGLARRTDPTPPMSLKHASDAQGDSPEGAYWPDSVRVVNRMDALTDHNGYFNNDEEVVRRVASEIQSDLYTDSIFWGSGPTEIEAAIPARRSRVGLLATVRLVAIAIGLVAVYLWGGSVATYLASLGLISGLLGMARDIAQFVSNLPIVGAPLGGVWVWAVVFALWLAGAAVASLAGLIPFLVVLWWWEASDRAARDRWLS